jgi:hypothetical protein
MKKIDLKPYDLEFKDKEGKTQTVPYDVKASLINCLYHPALKLAGRDLLLAHKLADKIEECKEDHILVELVDYTKLKNAVEKIEGFTKNDVEFVQRVLEAEDVEVAEKEVKKK